MGLETRHRPLSPEPGSLSLPVQDGNTTVVLDSIREGDFLASIGLKDAYYHVSIHQSLRRYLSFAYQGTGTSSRPSALSWHTAPPGIFLVFSLVSAWALSRGIRPLRYLDNWLVPRGAMSSGPGPIPLFLPRLVVNWERSYREPKRRARYWAC